MIVWNLSWEQRIAALRSWLASRLSIRANHEEVVISDAEHEVHVPLPQPHEPIDPWESWQSGGARL